MEIKVIATGEQIPGLLEFSGDIKPLCDQDHAPMVWSRVKVDHDSFFDALTCPKCGCWFTPEIGYFPNGDTAHNRRISCANDQTAMTLTEVSQEGETWSCTVRGCGRIELHSPPER